METPEKYTETRIREIVAALIAAKQIEYNALNEMNQWLKQQVENEKKQKNDTAE